MPQDGFPGQQQPSSEASPFNGTSFIVDQALRLISTATLVKVVSVTNDGGVSPVGFVDVLPLVNMVDGVGNSQGHGTLHALTYCRVQGGLNAIIMDPQIGDIGVAVFADRDISSVKVNKGLANPGSLRRFDMADGMYLFSVLGSAPNQYVQFNMAGITIADKNGNTIVMASGGITINGIFFPTGGISFDIKTHTHDQPNDSHDDTEQPTLAPNNGS